MNREPSFFQRTKLAAGLAAAGLLVSACAQSTEMRPTSTVLPSSPRVEPTKCSPKLLTNEKVVELKSNRNTLKIRNYFESSAGYTRPAASAIAAVAFEASGSNPKFMLPDDRHRRGSIKGIIGWHGYTLEGLESFAQKQGKDLESLDVQNEFLKSEFTKRNMTEKLQTVHSVDEVIDLTAYRYFKGRQEPCDSSLRTIARMVEDM